ncbi:hypothetical protein F2P81_002801 [Scophthalmus maximus]|uniref:Uncharacterized protein n=1 Tax=Scophthalmus maximus TaxID=52904 RepID=A0A6A4TW53_SCOMX|nr:hypothetical protein F2P81_002801 [Scophthalmus maximus]
MSGSCVRVDPPFDEFRDVSVGQVYRRTVTATNDGKTMKNIIFQTPNLKLLTAASAATEEMVRDCLLIHIDDVTVDIPLIGCIRVDPPFVEFSDVRVGDVYKTTVTATNDGKALKKIIFQKPNLKLFKFTAASAPEFVAPGLSVSGLLQFTPEQEEVVRDCLLIHTDDVTIEIPLIGFPRTCSLLTDSVLDFGCVAANSQIISKQHPITNQGSAPGVFQVKYSGDPSVRLSPSSGVIAGGATKWLKVELHTDRPRQIDEKALIKLQNRFAISLTVRAEVVDQRLEVSDLKGVSLSCLWFGPVYFGTSRVKKVVLRNNGPQACDWVCQFQDAAAGTEAGTDLHKSTHVTLLEGTGRCSLASQDFSQVLVFVPKQGRLGPYESTTVAIRFTPFRSRLIVCNSSVELAVTGSGLPVSLVASPSHRFDFPTCVTGQRVDLPFVLQNLCPQLPVYFHFRKLALFTTEPTKGTIAPGQCQDVVLTFMARQQGSFQVCQTLDVLGQVPQSSDGKDVSELELRSFHTLTLQMSAACHGPSLVDFGEVCVESVCVQTLELTNHLSLFVRVQLEVDCPELQGSSPLSHVLPPHSHNTLPLTFQSNKLGSFYRPVSYSVNQQHPGQILVQAQVVPLALELSTTLLVLRPTPTLLAQSGYRSSVTLRNHGNHTAEFAWRPVVTERGVLYSIRPATGTVEPYSELDCEVMWHPSFSSPEEGDFDLSVHEGDTQQLHCVAKLGSTSVQLAEKLVTFGSVPLNMPSARTAVLHNTGQNHAYYQVLDVSPLPGMTVSPCEGVVPSRGQAVLQIHFSPDSIIRFDTRVEAASYDFDLPLTINGVRWPTAPPSPFTSSSSSSTSSSSLSAVSRKHMVQPPSCPVAMVTQRLRRIQATVLCAPLELSPSSLQFHVEPLTPQSDVYTKTVELKAVCEESVCWQEAVGRRLHWWFSCSVAATSAEGRREAELCTVTPSSGSLGPGQSICLTVSIRPEAITTVSGRSIRLSLPLYLGDKDGEARAEEAEHQPYRELPVTVIVQIPSITIHPPQILLTPVPLENSAVATLTLLAVGYPSGTRISAEVDELKREDGTKMQPVAVTFPDGNCIPTQKQNQVQRQEANGTSLICRVSFSSAVPLSLCTTVTFTEQHFNNRFKVKLCAIADNCLLTVWPHMARHRSEQQIVLKTGNVHTNKHRCTKYGSTAVKAILQRYCTPSPASGPVSSSSSSFDHNNSTNKNSASDSFADSDSVSSQTSREEEVWSNRRTLANVGIPEFPTADSDEGRYHQSVLLAVERWFSLFGWPNGPHPISVPHTLRRIVTKTQVDPSGRRNFRVSQNLDHRSVVDMLHHLTGKQIPGIPRSGSFSTDIDKRTAELLQQHKAMLAFFRVQGACLWHIKPEYLLDMQEFKHWCSLQSKKEEAGPDFSSVDYESLSKRSWTDVLLQIYKVLVLCRVSENRPKTIPNREDGDGIRAVNLQPVTSNVYSAGEIQLLSWLNEHYQSMRKTVWGAGFVPSARWIVNFDLDLTDGLICSHFRRMYTAPSSLEQILHNNIVVVRSLTALSLNMDIQVRLKNPSSKHVKYQTFLLGEDAHLFSVPDGSTLTILPKASAELTVQHRCSFLRPVEAVLLLISSSAAALRATTLSFNLRTHVSHITTTNSVKCTSPCYELRVIQLPITNPFNMEAKFRMEEMMSDCGEDVEEKPSASYGEGSEFLSAVRSVCLKPGQADTLDIHYLPFCPGTKYCSVLLLCPQVGDTVYVVKATADLPLPSPLTTRPSSNIVSSAVCASALSLRCKVQQVCEELVRMPLINASWERALAIWGQQSMNAKEHRRRSLTHTLYSSTVRTNTAIRKLQQKEQLLGGGDHSEVVTYSVEVSLPRYFTLPSTVKMPVKEDTHKPWDHPAEFGHVDVPFRFQADRAGHFTCQGKLSLHNNYDGTEHVFTLRGIGERPLPVDHVVIHCPVGMTTHTQLDVPNYRQNKLTLKVVTDISVVSGSPTLEIKPGQKTPYTLAVSPRTQGKQTGCVSFVEVDKIQEEDKGRAFRRYEVFFSLEVICEPPAPVKVIDVQCAAQSSVAIEIPVINPRAELLMLDVDLSGDDLSGAGLVSVPPQDTFTYKATFSPGRVGKSSGSVVFRSELVGEICYRLELYALPPPVTVIHRRREPHGKDHFLMPSGIQISEGASFDVPVVFVPDSMELQHVWLCISLKPLGSSGNNSNFSPDKPRSEQDLPTICWIRPLRGIPVEVPVDNSPLGVVQCDAGCQLERKVDVLLRGSVPGNGEQEVSGVTAEDFLCEVRSNGEAERSGAEDCLSASIQAARRNPETGNVTLTLHLVYTPLRPCRHSVVLAVRSVSGRIWKFPIILVATEPQVDDVILTEATELDKTSGGGVPLTTILEMEIETQFSFGAEIFIFGTRKCCRVTQPSSTGQNSDSRAALDQRGDSSSRAACSPVNEPQQSVTSHDFRPPSLPR